MEPPPARLHEQFARQGHPEGDQRPPPSDPRRNSPTSIIPPIAKRRNLAELARAGKVLEIGRPNNMAGGSGGRRPRAGASPNDDASNSYGSPPESWHPPPEDSYDPEKTEYGGDSNIVPASSGCSSDKHSCNSCLDVGSGDLHVLPGRSHCVWCASSGSCLERSSAFDLDRRSKIKNDAPPAPGTCRAGIATYPRHCGEIVDKIQKHFESQGDPLQSDAEKELAKTMHFQVKIGWPQQGDWVGHSEPSDIGLEGFFRAEEGKPTLVDICYSLFGPSSSSKPLIKRCKSIRNPELGNLTFPEPGPYTLSAWALDNVDDRFLSPLVTVAFDRLPSELYEEGCYSTDPHAPGFPNVLEDTGLSTIMLRTNRKLFVPLGEEDDPHRMPLMYRPSGFEAGGGLQTQTTRMIHTMWWEGMDDLRKTSIAAKRGLHALDPKLQHLSTWSHSFTQHHASSRWTYRVWDHVSMAELFEQEFAGVFSGTFDRLKNKVDRMNLSKYMILLHHGGVVVGSTVECMKPLDALVIQTGVVLANEPNERGEMKISNDFMSSPPWHPLWWIVLHEIKRRVGVMEQQVIQQMKDGGGGGGGGGGVENTEEGEGSSSSSSSSKEGFLDLTGTEMLTHAVKLYQELYPDTSLKILNDADETMYGGKRVVAMDGGAKDYDCTMRGDCSLTFKDEFVLKHYVESVEDETRLASTGSKDKVKKEEATIQGKEEKRKIARAKAGKVEKLDL